MVLRANSITVLPFTFVSYVERGGGKEERKKKEKSTNRFVYREVQRGEFETPG